MWAFLTKMFNGNETARSMRYSVTVMLIIVGAGYMGLLQHADIIAMFYVMIGYITGKSRTETRVIEGKEHDAHASIGVRHSGDTHHTVSTITTDSN
jgi:hypothetical protein